MLAASDRPAHRSQCGIAPTRDAMKGILMSRSLESLSMNESDAQGGASLRAQIKQSMEPMAPLKDLAMNPITVFLALVFLVGAAGAGYIGEPLVAAALVVLAVLVGASSKVANVWQKFVILRLGKLQCVRGAGVFVIIPLIDRVIAVIDGRIQTTAFNAEQALTKDTVPVNVDAIIFWHVNDAEKAALAITNYREAIDRVAQTSLRDMIGSSMLANLLSDRKDADEQLKVEIGTKTAPWGISVTSVKIRDVAIPVALQDAMSRRAQASARSRRASFSARPSWRSQASSCRPQPSTTDTRGRCNCAQ
jgi:uncharacterized membrane protein YqiK